MKLTKQSGNYWVFPNGFLHPYSVPKWMLAVAWMVGGVHQISPKGYQYFAFTEYWQGHHFDWLLTSWGYRTFFDDMPF